VTTPTYTFRRATSDDLPLLARWLAERHVAKWWGKAEAELRSIEAHIAGDDAEPLIVLLDGVPIGYLQWWPASTDPDVPPQPDGTRGVDFLIGETAALGKGHGPGLLKAFADGALAAGTPRLVSDPDGRNVSSVGCLGRAGFSPDCLIGPPGARRLLMFRDLIPQAPRARSADRPSRRRRETR
jgi:aminoglycoside 6'-N-acetyltransferase